jgi:PilZ domain
MDLDLHREILSALEYVFAAKKEVRLLNVHKGMPISYPATIQELGEQGIVFKVQKYQLVCLALEKQTFIQSEQLPSIVRAKLIGLDYPKTEVTLQNFAYTLNTIGKRQTIRVQPQEPIQVLINDNVRKIKGLLVDISETGLGVVTVGAGVFSPNLLRRGAPILFTFRLPGETSDLFLAGTIRNTARDIDNVSYRLGIQISPDSQAHEAIMRFISRRKTRIQVELDVLYTQLSQK